MVKSRGLSWIALKHHKILAVKVQYSHCSKLDNFRPGVRFGKILEFFVKLTFRAYDTKKS
jgi:hypothetical protein